MELLTADERTALSPKEYLEQSYILLFLEDAITDALVAYTNGDTESPIQGISKYFASGLFVFFFW